MRSHVAALLLMVLALVSVSNVRAQDETRNKLEMSITYGGKTITTTLLSVSTSISRYSSDDYAPEVKDSVTGKNKATDEKRSSVYLSMVVKKVSADLLKLFSKRDTRFDGTITITDSYGKNPQKTIAFKNGLLETYSDQFSGADYNDSYSGSNVSISCKSLTLNGVEIEQ